MNEQSQLPYWWAGMLSLFSALSLQDYIFILGTMISIIFTVKTYYVNVREKNAIIIEEQRRTELLRCFLSNAPVIDISTAIAVCNDALDKMDH
ncbi:putative bacteriophage protein [Yersinia massiliensis]|uniref:hypothetical protein n=1 Tax=Yersinia massiliensis TaxID=419257 RepID=UPI0005E8EF49|nr:hypothetical protein [Yersinia massiliensis]CNH58378.1 putative bacteriophage protein [Yersinia massiliensis]